MNKTKLEGVSKQYDSPQMEIVFTLQTDFITCSTGGSDTDEALIGDIW